MLVTKFMWPIKAISASYCWLDLKSMACSISFPFPPGYLDMDDSRTSNQGIKPHLLWFCFNPRPCTVFFITRTCRWGWGMMPLRVWKLSVVEISEKNSGLLSKDIPTWDWKCVFFNPRPIFDSVMYERKNVIFSQKRQHFNFTYTYLKNCQAWWHEPFTSVLPDQFWTKWCVAVYGPKIFDVLHSGRDQRHPDRQNRLRANWVNDPDWRQIVLKEAPQSCLWQCLAMTS